MGALIAGDPCAHAIEAPASKDAFHRQEEMEIGNMGRARLLFGVANISVAMLGATAAQRLDLPAGLNRDLVSRACQACHDLSMVVAATGLTREGWNATIEEMVSYGMRVDKEDREKILEYLSSYLGSK